ncbi:hypothetical protein CVT26_012267 [Gymnopilus dilepis]|uniref:Uncharacterized protein n=1 Tax=Gymnopilus dilepis TaxID=231916 RepID=A0A409YQA0_9AGAR|nr:hypothetical protein CVT26_012267 [Gymnopilus dilepis]
MVATSPKKGSSATKKLKGPRSSKASQPETPTRRTPRRKNVVAQDGVSKSPTIPDGVKKQRRCNRCPGRPLTIQCQHTKQGEKYLREQALRQELRAPSPDIQDEQTQVQDLRTPSSSQRSDTEGASSPSHEEQTPEVHGDVFLEQTTLADTTSAFSSSLMPPSLPGSQGIGDVSSTPSTATVSTPSTVSSISKRKQVRTTASNPYNGFVVGAFRGQEPFSVVRGHPLPAPIADTQKASKHFTSTISSILTKCEDLANQTGCWLFLGAQHPTAKLGAVNYASPRLRRDATEDSGSVATSFCRLTTKLIRAKNSDTLKLADELEMSRKQVQAVKQALEVATKTRLDIEVELERYKLHYGVIDKSSVPTKD